MSRIQMRARRLHVLIALRAVTEPWENGGATVEGSRDAFYLLQPIHIRSPQTAAMAPPNLRRGFLKNWFAVEVGSFRAYAR